MILYFIDGMTSYYEQALQVIGERAASIRIDDEGDNNGESIRLPKIGENGGGNEENSNRNSSRLRTPLVRQSENANLLSRPPSTSASATATMKGDNESQLSFNAESSASASAFSPVPNSFLPKIDSRFLSK